MSHLASDLPKPLHGVARSRRGYAGADIEHTVIGDDLAVADHVRWLGHCGEPSDVDLLGDLGCVIDLDAELAGC